jgi:hypothetical protein
MPSREALANNRVRLNSAAGVSLSAATALSHGKQENRGNGDQDYRQPVTQHVGDFSWSSICC